MAQGRASHLRGWRLLPTVALLLLLPPRPLLATKHALLALAGTAVRRSPLARKVTRGLHQLATAATLCWHLHVDKSLLAAPHDKVLALLAGACQPVRIVPLAVEGGRCQHVAASPALLLLGRALFPAAKGTHLLCDARQAAAFAAAAVFDMLGKPSGWHQLEALFADLIFLRWWVLCPTTSAQHAASIVVLPGIVWSYREHGRMPCISVLGRCNIGRRPGHR